MDLNQTGKTVWLCMSEKFYWSSRLFAAQFGHPTSMAYDDCHTFFK